MKMKLHNGRIISLKKAFETKRSKKLTLMTFRMNIENKVKLNERRIKFDKLIFTQTLRLVEEFSL